MKSRHPYVVRARAEARRGARPSFTLSPAELHLPRCRASTAGSPRCLLERRCAEGLCRRRRPRSAESETRGDPRIISLEGVNARDLAPALISEEVDAVVADVSFIGLKLVLPPPEAGAQGAWLVALVKPQFEAGRDRVGRGGLVKDNVVQEDALQGIVDWLGAQPGWTVIGTMESPIVGGDGIANSCWRRERHDRAVPSFRRCGGCAHQDHGRLSRLQARPGDRCAWRGTRSAR